MPDKDSRNYSYQKRYTESGDAKMSERAMISIDRSQKLDLLIHLLTNLQQSLIVCGPQGIGKTTLLHTLEARNKDVWPICILQGSSDLSFESVIKQLSRFLKLSSASGHFDMNALRRFCEKQKLVLAIDDAGDLVPGLMRELIDFADAHAGLRLILSLDYDEYQTKTGGEGSVENCHIIELPPLNQRQCLEFLQNISIQPGAALNYAAITDTLVEDLYLETQGIPGKLLAQLPRLEQYQNRQQRKIGLWLGMLVIMVTAAYVANALLQKPEPEIQAESSFETTPVSQPISVPEVSSLDAQTEIEDSRPIEKQSLNELAVVQPEIVFPAVNPASAVEPTLMVEPEAATIATEQKLDVPKPASSSVNEPKASGKTLPEVATKPDATNLSDLEWIKAQPASNYTVQIMVLSNKAAVGRVMKKYAEHSDQLKYYPIGNEGQEKYVIIYGSFPASVDALKQKATMPEVFNNGIIKRFKYIQ